MKHGLNKEILTKGLTSGPVASGQFPCMSGPNKKKGSRLSACYTDDADERHLCPGEYLLVPMLVSNYLHIAGRPTSLPGCTCP